MAKEIEPHTDEWFEAVNVFDPLQAQHTRAIVDEAGFVAVCSICGDANSARLKLVSPEPHPDSVSSIRLCPDCRGMRERDYGEAYARL